MLDELDQPLVTDGVEEATNVRIEHPVHLLPEDPHRQRVQRVVRRTARPEPVREAQEIDLVDRVENRPHRVLDDLVLQRGDAQRPLRAVRLRYEHPLDRGRPIRSGLHPPKEVRNPIIEAHFVLLPRHPVDARSRLAFQGVEAPGQGVGRDVVQQGGEPCLLILPSYFSHPLQAGRHADPALRRGCGRLERVPLSRSPSLHHLRRRWRSVVVRRLLRYYATVRLPTAVRVGLGGCPLPRPIRRTTSGWRWDLPVPVQGVSTRAQGLRLRGVRGRLADDADVGVAFRVR